MWFNYYRYCDLTFEAIDGRWRWYEQPVSPWGFFDGARSPQVTEPDSFYSWYGNMFDGARSQTSPLEMWLDSATTGVDSPMVRIGVHINPTDSVVDEMESLMLVGVVFEDSIPYVSQLHQGDTVYTRLVVREIIADTWGVPISVEFPVEFSTTLGATLGEWRTDMLGVAAFVQDTATKKVLQSVVQYRLMTADGRR